MNKKQDNFDVLLNQYIKSILPYSEKFQAEDLVFDNLGGQRWRLKIKNQFLYPIYFFRNFSGIWTFIAVNQVQDEKFLAIFDRLTVDQAEELRNKNIEFIDKRGNIFLNLPDLYLFVSGRKKSYTSIDNLTINKEDYLNKIFKIAGVKLLYTILTDSNLDNPPQNILNSPFRDIAQTAQISLGSTSGIIKAMENQGYIVIDNRTRLLMNRKELFRNWINGFIDYRARWHVVHLASNNFDWWKTTDLKGSNIFWGGETAANILTEGFLIPEETTIYTGDLIYDFTLKHDLRLVDSGGDVKLITRSSEFLPKREDACIHPLLVYADLIFSGKNRNHEAATRIYDLYLRKIIEPD